MVVAVSMVDTFRALSKRTIDTGFINRLLRPYIV